jgi:hypothetical protein
MDKKTGIPLAYVVDTLAEVMFFLKEEEGQEMLAYLKTKLELARERGETQETITECRALIAGVEAMARVLGKLPAEHPKEVQPFKTDVRVSIAHPTDSQGNGDVVLEISDEPSGNVVASATLTPAQFTACLAGNRDARAVCEWRQLDHIGEMYECRAARLDKRFKPTSRDEVLQAVADHLADGWFLANDGLNRRQDTRGHEVVLGRYGKRPDAYESFTTFRKER